MARAAVRDREAQRAGAVVVRVCQDLRGCGWGDRGDGGGEEEVWVLEGPGGFDDCGWGWGDGGGGGGWALSCFGCVGGVGGPG